MTFDNDPSASAGDLRCADSLTELESVENESIALVVSSPPYNIGKPYEKKVISHDEYYQLHQEIAKNLVNKLKKDGSICWQVGNHVRDKQTFPLDYVFYKIFTDLGLQLRNRIIWRFNFGLNADRRFSGRYETILWFTKTDDYFFNLDPVRVPQLYPGKRHPQTKGTKAGQPSGNPKGKNPGDFWEFDANHHFWTDPVWDIPNVKSLHPEKTVHNCQFPVELVERCVLALTKPGDTILDPFSGVGTTTIAAVKHGRNGIGIEKDANYHSIAQARLSSLREGHLAMRPLGRPVLRPRRSEKVAQIPVEWLNETATS